MDRPRSHGANSQGFANGGSGLGGLIFANTTRLALERLGVKWALIINGCISLVVLLPVVFLLKGRHKALQTRSMSLELKWFVHPGFVWILLWACFCSGSCFLHSCLSLPVPPSLCLICMTRLAPIPRLSAWATLLSHRPLLPDVFPDLNPFLHPYNPLTRLPLPLSASLTIRLTDPSTPPTSTYSPTPPVGRPLTP